jgi:hypothetical protein
MLFCVHVLVFVEPIKLRKLIVLINKYLLFLVC